MYNICPSAFSSTGFVVVPIYLSFWFIASVAMTAMNPKGVLNFVDCIRL